MFIWYYDNNKLIFLFFLFLLWTKIERKEGKKNIYKPNHFKENGFAQSHLIEFKTHWISS